MMLKPGYRRLLTILAACLAAVLLGLARSSQYLGLVEVVETLDSFGFYGMVAPASSVDTLCDECKATTVGRHFSCIDRIKRHVAENIALSEAQKIVSREYTECSVCDRSSCKTTDSPNKKTGRVAMLKDKQGKWGYIHDPKFVTQHKNPHSFTIPILEKDQICAPPGNGPEGSNETHEFLSKILHISKTDNSKTRLFCAVYTYSGGINLTQAQLETWAQRCDGYLAASTYTDQSHGIVGIPAAGSNAGDYRGIWQKVRSMLSYMYDNYLEDYDYFHINGDDVYVIVENLKDFLSQSKPAFVGHWTPFFGDPNRMGRNLGVHLNLSKDFYYAGGGPGYTISQSTLKRLVEEILPNCLNSTYQSPEDLFIGYCLWEAGVQAEEEWDETGAHRYNALDADFFHRYRGRPCRNDRLCNYWSGAQDRLSRSHPHFPRTTGFGIRKFVSNMSVSFHLIKTPAKMRRYEKLIYRGEATSDCL